MRYELFDNYDFRIAFDQMTHRQGRYRLLFLFSEDILRQEVADLAYSQGESARVHDNYGHDLLVDNKEGLLHTFKDICEDQNFNRVRNCFKMAMGDLEQMFLKYNARWMNGNMSLDNVPRDTVEYVIELKIPGTFAEVTAWQMMRLSKEYMEVYALADWASQTFPEGATYWLNRKMEIEAEIRKIRSYCGTNHIVKPSIV